MVNITLPDGSVRKYDQPVSVGEISEGMELLVLRIAKAVIPLSSSVTDPSVYSVCEKVLGINLTDYALGRGSPS